MEYLASTTLDTVRSTILSAALLGTFWQQMVINQHGKKNWNVLFLRKKISF